MHYYSRPSWRSQWLELVVETMLFLCLIVAVGWSVAVERTSVVVVALGVIGVAFVLLGSIMLYRKYSWRFAIDDENIESRRGIIARQIRSIRVKDLRNVNVRQSIMQRILGIGDVEFSSAAGGGVEVMFFGVADPLSVRNLAQRLQGDRPSSDG